VGALTAAGKYKLTDAAYSKLLHEFQSHYTELPQELRSDILAFYRNLDASIWTRPNDNKSSRLLKELDLLRAVDADLRHPSGAEAEAPLSK
jgi:hypothetical protein